MRKTILLISFITVSIAINAQTLYVKANAAGANNGTSWANAFTDLETALATAFAVGYDQVWVAAGTYKPTRDENGVNHSPGYRGNTFRLRSGVKMYGGFNGTENSVAQRNIKVNPTVLSGDFNGDDGPDFAHTDDNFYHVVLANTLTATVILDGFIISGGNADSHTSFLGSPQGNEVGGGLYSVSNQSFLSISNCIFRNNYAASSGGAFSNQGTPTFSSPSIKNTVFVANTAVFGGGINSSNFGTPVIANCVFTNNSASMGSGIYASSLVNITNTTVAMNSCSSIDPAGAIQISGWAGFGSASSIKNSIVRNNTNGNFYFSGSGPSPLITYSNVQNNPFLNTGDWDADALFFNVNDPDGPDNIFVTNDDGLALLTASPSANTGSNALVPEGITTDIVGDFRIQNATVNMGAYETLVTEPIIYVKANATGANNGTSWANAYGDLEMALTNASAYGGAQVWVAAGTYKPTKDENGVNQYPNYPGNTFRLRVNVRMYGGFAGTENSVAQRSIKSNPTILSGDFVGDDGPNFSNRSDNFRHVVTASSLTGPALLDGFIISGGYANSNTSFLGNPQGNSSGGGFYSGQNGNTLTVINCIIRNNYASNSGGAFFNDGTNTSSSPTIVNTMFSDNQSAGEGAGLYSQNSGVLRVFGCVITNNSGTKGSAIRVVNSNTNIANCTIAANTSTGSSTGAVDLSPSGTPTIANSIIRNNTNGNLNFPTGGPTPNVTYSNVQTHPYHPQPPLPGVGNIDADASFVNVADPDGSDNIIATSDDGLVLLSNSLSANTGDNASIPSGITTDLLGDARIQNGSVNMGALETLAGQRIYVQPNAGGGAHNGTSWENAYTNIESALDAAVSGGEIWVVFGYYKPSRDENGVNQSPSYRGNTFRLKSNVKMYGGFYGNETSLAQRNFKANPTVLKGDFNNDDGPDFRNREDNFYHVVTASGLTGPALLDGFVISGGFANSDASFLGNPSGNLAGGGLYSTQNSSFLSVVNCIFRSNYSSSWGGAFFNDGAYTSSSPTIINSVFEGNRSTVGAAVYSSNPGVLTVIGCVIINNAGGWGSGISVSGGNVNIANSTIALNSCTGIAAAAVYMSANGGTPSIKNSIIRNNTNGDNTNGNFRFTGTTPVVTYSNIENNPVSGTGDIDNDASFINITDPDGNDNIFATSDDGLALLTNSLSANTGSNASIPAGVTTDVAGDARIQDGTVNMGAYETLAGRRIYVNANAIGANNGTSWANAFTDLEPALALSVGRGEIWVAAGTYKPTRDENGVYQFPGYAGNTFRLRGGVKMYGGFSGTENSVAQRVNIKNNPSILSGDFNGNDGPGFTNRSDNFRHVVTANALGDAATLDGFIISGGYANSNTPFLGNPVGNATGAGLYSSDNLDFLTIINCVYRNNFASYSGGAIANYCPTRQFSSPSIVNSVLESNSSQNGGAVYSSNPGKVVIGGCLIVHNSATLGSAILTASSNVDIINCTIAQNTCAGVSTGAVDLTTLAGTVFFGPSTITNSIVRNNTNGSIKVSAGPTPAVTYSNIENNTISGTGNVDADAVFVNAADVDGPDDIFATRDDGLVLITNSPSANTGYNFITPRGTNVDIVGDPRIQNNNVNMGAYETLVPQRIYVKANAAGVNNGTSWANAYTNLESALGVISRGGEIWVAAGTYKPTKDENGVDQSPGYLGNTFRLRDEVRMYGGFNGTESSLSARNFKINPTILSGDFNGDDGPNFTNRTDNFRHVVTAYLLSGPVLLDGFVISGGNANSNTPFLGNFVGNAGGGGIYSGSFTYSYLNIVNCIYRSNYASYGGAFYNDSFANPTIINSVFESNRSSDGGAIYSQATPGVVTVIGCLMVKNSANWGSAIFIANSTIDIFNSTIAQNTGIGFPTRAVALMTSGGTSTIANSIIRDNDGGNLELVAGENPVVTYSNIGNNPLQGRGNIDDDASFFNAADLDGTDNIFGTPDDGLVLIMNSPSADTGENASIPSGITLDIVGAPRIQDLTVNMGAYETLVTKLVPTITITSPNTGNYLDVINLTADTGGSTGAVTYSVENGTGSATLTSGTSLLLTGVGTVTITASVEADANYFGGKASQTITINPANPQVIITSPNTGTYGGTINLTATTGGSTGALTYTVASGGGTATLSGSTLSLTGAGTVTVTATVAPAANYNPATATQTVTINKANPVVSITSPAIGTYGATLSLTASTGGSTGAVTYTTVNGTGSASVVGNILQLLGAGTVTVTATVAADANYNSATATQTITISKASPVVSITSPAVGTYGTSINMTASTGGSTGAVTYTTVNGTGSAAVTGNILQLLGAGTVTVTAAVAADANYNSATSTPQTVTINKASSTIIITSAAAGTYGSSINLTANASGSSGAVAYTVANGTGAATVSGNTLSLTGAGTVTVIATLAADANYNSATATQSITIGKITPSVSITSVNTGPYGSTLNLITNKGGSTGAVTYTVANGTGTATVSASILSLTGVGTVTVTASVAPDANYNSASATQIVTITKANQVISFGPLQPVTVGDFPVNPRAISSSGLAVSYTSSDPSVASIFRGLIVISSEGTTDITASQAGNANYNPAISVVQTLTVMPAGGGGPGEQSVAVYPVPASTSFTITTEKGIASVQVLQIDGSVQASYHHDGTNSITIDTHSYNRGLYFLRIQTKDKQISTRKIAIDK